MLKLKSRDERNILGRGTVKLVDLQEHGIYNPDKLPISVGDTIELDGEAVIIKGIEYTKNLVGIAPRIGIVYRQLN